MILSDAMDRNVQHAQTIVRRAERMIEDSSAAEKSLAQGSSASRATSDTADRIKLRVDGEPTARWLKRFRWDRQTWDCD